MTIQQVLYVIIIIVIQPIVITIQQGKHYCYHNSTTNGLNMILIVDNDNTTSLVALLHSIDTITAMMIHICIYIYYFCETTN